MLLEPAPQGMGGAEGGKVVQAVITRIHPQGEVAPRLKRTGLRAESAHPNQRVLFRLHLHTSAEFSICIRRSPRMMKAQSENASTTAVGVQCKQ